MMEQTPTGESPVNPQLSDIFRTALRDASAPKMPCPNITVNGSGNVFAWGGTVYLSDRARRKDTE
jgi:hypothetical protein